MNPEEEVIILSFIFQRCSAMGLSCRVLLVFLLCIFSAVKCFQFSSHSTTSQKGNLVSRKTKTLCYASALDSRELTKIFLRFSAKTILLDVPGAGTPEMANCCHGGCDNCNYSHVFDSLSAARGKWVPTYFARTLIDGRTSTAPWAAIFNSDGVDTIDIGLDKAIFTERVSKLPCVIVMGPGLTVPADEAPLEAALETFWNMMLTALSDTGEVDLSADYRLTAENVSVTLMISAR